MLDSLILQVLDWREGVVFIPLGFGLAVGLGYVIVSAAWHRRKRQ
jgi:hypothetical protein